MYVWSTGLFEMIVGDLTTCHTQHIWDSRICIFLFNRKALQVLLHTLQLLYKCTLCDSTVLFEMTVGVLTTCHTQYTWDSSICIFYLIEQHITFLLHTSHIPELKVQIRTTIETTTYDMLQTVVTNSSIVLMFVEHDHQQPKGASWDVRGDLQPTLD